MRNEEHEKNVTDALREERQTALRHKHREAEMVRRLVVVTVSILAPVLLSAQWSTDPAVNTVISDTTGAQVQPHVVVDEQGESFVSWFSHPPADSYDVYLQRLDADGNRLWAPAGLMVSNKPTMPHTSDYGLVLDRDSNAVLVNQDIRTGYSDVFAYRISPAGQLLWGNDGVQLTNDSLQNLSPCAVATEQGDIVFAWRNYDTMPPASVGLQRVSLDGQLKWGSGLVISDTVSNDVAALLRTEDDNVIVAWCRYADVPESSMHILVQKVDSAGDFLWANPVRVDTGDMLPVSSIDISPQLVNDGNGGVFVLWEAVPSTNHTLFVQHVDAGGAVQWPPNGIELSTRDAHGHTGADLCYLPDGPALFVFWQEYYEEITGNKDSYYKGLYGQRISLSGARLWTDTGKVFDPLDPDTSCVSIVVKKGQGNDVAVFYQRKLIAGTSLYDIVAMRLDQDGAYVWPQERVTLSSTPGEKHFLTVSDFAHNQWVGVWSEARSESLPDDYGIYAQNINRDGSLGPSGIEETPRPVPLEKNLLVNSPNRAAKRVAITYAVSACSPVVLAVYDLSGALIRTLVKEVRNPGSYTVEWDTESLPAGVYLVRLAAGDFGGTKKLVLTR